MDSVRIIRGSFVRERGVKGRALTGGGSVSWETGALEIRGRLSRPTIRVITGCLGVVLGLALVVGTTAALDQYDVVDLMRHRKGPVFVTFLALIAMAVGYGWIAAIADWLLEDTPLVPGSHRPGLRQFRRDVGARIRPSVGTGIARLQHPSCRGPLHDSLRGGGILERGHAPPSQRARSVLASGVGPRAAQ